MGNRKRYSERTLRHRAILKVDIGDRIREARESQGITQESLAHHLGIPAPQLSNWESGKHLPSARRVVDLADAIGVPPSVFSAHACWGGSRVIDTYRTAQEAGTRPRVELHPTVARTREAYRMLRELAAKQAAQHAARVGASSQPPQLEPPAKPAGKRARKRAGKPASPTGILTGRLGTWRVGSVASCGRGRLMTPLPCSTVLQPSLRGVLVAEVPTPQASTSRPTP